MVSQVKWLTRNTKNLQGWPALRAFREGWVALRARLENVSWVRHRPAFDRGSLFLLRLTQRLRQSFPRDPHSPTQLVQSHLLDHLLRLGIQAGTRPRRHLRFEVPENS